MTDDDGGFARFVFDDAALPAYAQPPPMTYAEITALLESFDRHKQRLIVPTGRVAEFEAAVRAAGLGHAVTVIGHAWLKEDQAYLAASEAQIEDDVKAAVLADIRANLEELTTAAGAQLRANIEEQARWERAIWRTSHLPPRSPFRGLFETGGSDG